MPQPCLNQLTEVWYGADAADPEELTDYEQHQQYELDPLGNRLTLDADGSQTEYQPNNGQRLTNPMNRYEQAGEAELSYDETGNLLRDGTNSYGYDVLNRQISVTTLDSSAEYVYDALGRRVAKVVDDVTTYYLYNAGSQVIEERDSADALQARYSYGSGIDEPLSMERGGNLYYYHRDGLGSVTEVSDASGTLVERYEYDVYGAPTIFDSNENPLTESAIGNPYLFTGRRYDPESGNYYYRARIYSPELGRFLQTDPLGYVDGLNLYTYVGNNPASEVDPLGLMTGVEVMGGAALLEGGGLVAAAPYALVPIVGRVGWWIGSEINERWIEPWLWGDEEDTLPPPAAMMDEGDDGEDASSVTPTDDDKICEVDAGPGTDPQQQNPKPPKGKRYDATKDIYDKLKELFEGRDTEEISQLERLHQDSILNKNTLDYWRGKSIDEIIDSLKLPGPEQLRIRPDGTVVQGNHRIKVLEEFGYDTSTLIEYAEIMKKDPLAPWE